MNPVIAPTRTCKAVSKNIRRCGWMRHWQTSQPLLGGSPSSFPVGMGRWLATSHCRFLTKPSRKKIIRCAYWWREGAMLMSWSHTSLKRKAICWFCQGKLLRIRPRGSASPVSYTTEKRNGRAIALIIVAPERWIIPVHGCWAAPWLIGSFSSKPSIRPIAKITTSRKKGPCTGQCLFSFLSFNHTHIHIWFN